MQKINYTHVTEQVKSWVDAAKSPSFILNNDERFSISYANSAFYEVFGTDQQVFADLYSNQFSNTLTFQDQVAQISKLRSAMVDASDFSGNAEVITATGHTKQVSFSVTWKGLAHFGEILPCISFNP